MQLTFSTWTHHLNQLIYSYFYFCEKEKLKTNIIFDSAVVHNGAVLFIEGKNVFFDFSDDFNFLEKPHRYSYYFKRSLRLQDKQENVYPLNFNVPMTYKCHSLLLHLKRDLLLYKRSRVEVIKAIDKYALFTKSSHGVLDIRRYPKEVADYEGNVIFHTRLWNPDNHPDSDEKERRILQNEFRINACRIIKKNFPSSSVGLFSDDLSKKLAPDLLLDSKHSKKNNYLNMLNKFNIGIADDGLKDTPGWKIGEYLLFGKAVITTPLNISVDNFKEGINYEALSTRSSYLEIPSKIESLLKNKKYLEVGNANKEWSDYYIHPNNYMRRILSIIN